MSNCLHLAIPAGDLKVAKAFYCDVLGCKTGNSEEGRWVDIDFWGNQQPALPNSDFKRARRAGLINQFIQWIEIENKNKQHISKQQIVEKIKESQGQIILTIGAGDIGEEVKHIKESLSNAS